MQAAKVLLNEYEFPTSKLANVQSQLEKLVEKNYYLHQSAKDAYRSYLLSYNSHQLKNIFNVHALDLASVGKSFGFVTPPRVGLVYTQPCLVLPACFAKAILNISITCSDAYGKSLWQCIMLAVCYAWSSCSAKITKGHPTAAYVAVTPC